MHPLVALRQQLPWREWRIGLNIKLGCHHPRVQRCKRAAARAAGAPAGADRAASVAQGPVSHCRLPQVSVIALATSGASPPQLARRGAQCDLVSHCRIVQARSQLREQVWARVLELGLGCSTARSQSAGSMSPLSSCSDVRSTATPVLPRLTHLGQPVLSFMRALGDVSQPCAQTEHLQATVHIDAQL